MQRGARRGQERGSSARRAGSAVLAGGLALLWALATAAAQVGSSPTQGASPADEGEVRATLALRGDPVAGAQAYKSCAACHLPSGAGRPDGTFPQLAGQHASVIVKQLIDMRDGRRRNPVMEPYARTLVDDQEIADIAAYVASLPVPAALDRGPGDDLERGAALYRRDCVPCHGARGEGDAAKAIPVLGGQHYGYLLRQVRTIAAGRRGNESPVMHDRVAPYTDAELRAVVDYASRLPGPAREGAP